MLKIMLLRKKYEANQKEQAELRTKLAGFKTREGELAAQVENASTEAEIAAAAAAVEEMENAQRSAKERLNTIIEEAEAIKAEIEEAEAAANGAAAGDGGEGGEEGRSARSSGASWQRRCQEFQRTGRMVYENARSMIKRAAVTTATQGIVGPTGVSGINDPAGNAVSDWLDLIKITDATGMAAYSAYDT